MNSGEREERVEKKDGKKEVRARTKREDEGKES